MNFEDALRYNSALKTGRSAVRLARLLWEQEGPGFESRRPDYMGGFPRSTATKVICGGAFVCVERKYNERVKEEGADAATL